MPTPNLDIIVPVHRLTRTFAAVAMAAGLILAGCAPAPLIREPADGYAPGVRGISQEMLEAAQETLAADPKSPAAERALYLIAQHSFENGRFDDMEKNVSALEKLNPESPWLSPAAYLGLLFARRQEGSLMFLQRLNSSLKRFPADETFAARTRELLEPTLKGCTDSDLETFLAESPDQPLTPDAMLVLSRLHADRGDADKATPLLRQMVRQFPGAAATPAAFQMLKELARLIPTNPRAIGILLPESGQYSEYGTSAKRGILLALEDMRAGGNAFEPFFADTREDPGVALQELDRLIKQDQVVSLLGPLFSATTLACAAEANMAGIPLITPSALSSRLTLTGPYVFRVALTPEQQATTMARFAATKMGFRKFGVLAPDTAYGRSLAAAFAAEAGAQGATVLVESRYPLNSPDFRQAIVALGGADIVTFEENEEEFKRSGQAELEIFLGSLFSALDSLPAPAPSSTVSQPDGEPPVRRISCVLLTPEPYTYTMAQGIYAAALSRRGIAVTAPDQPPPAVGPLARADVGSFGMLSNYEELKLAEVLSNEMARRKAAFSVLISVNLLEATEAVERLECTLALYDDFATRQMAVHRFEISRPLRPRGNRCELEAIYVPASGAQVVQIAPQLRYHSIDLPLLGSDSWDDEALRRKPEAIGGEAYFTVGFSPETGHKAAQEFAERFKERYAAPPDSLAAHSYDAARLLMEAVLRSDGTREGVRETLSEFGVFEGATGIFRQGASREAEKEAIVLKIESGSFVAVE